MTVEPNHISATRYEPSVGIIFTGFEREKERKRELHVDQFIRIFLAVGKFRRDSTSYPVLRLAS